MMKSNSFWAIIILGGFVALFFWLRSIDWVGMFNIEKHTRDTEEKLGDLFWEHLGDEGDQITDSATVAAMDSLVSRICVTNSIPLEHIKVHVFRADVVNAFAMPGGHLVVNSALIEDCKTPEQLCGVLAHEIAHIQLGHVMGKLTREVGVAVLLGITTGGSDSGLLAELIATLSTKAFDREMEKEADLKAVEYLTHAQIDARPFADFLYSTNENAEESPLRWLSTHPSSKERQDYVNQEIVKRQTETRAVIHIQTWLNLKNNISAVN
jgi:predicted Zn-dependent protease